MYKPYLKLVKPGIIFGNLISVSGGFLLASRSKIDYTLFLFTLISTLLIIASSCVLNNYIDKDIDKKMKRTANREFVTNTVSLPISLIYAIFLGFLGFILLWTNTNKLAFIFGVLGYLIYVSIYSLYMKRHSIYSTFFGSFSGASPPLIGYCAVSNKFDYEALILLVIFILWQMPHFYAIAILHFQDYQSANIPLFPIKKGILATKNHIVFYVIAFLISTLMLFLKGYAGYKYLVITSIMNLVWLIIAIQGYKTLDNVRWARKLFLLSIVVIFLFSMMISIDNL